MDKPREVRGRNIRGIRGLGGILSFPGIINDSMLAKHRIKKGDCCEEIHG